MDEEAEIIISPGWEYAASAIADHHSPAMGERAASFPPVALVCGPQNSGKSTFSRHLLNVLLRRYKRVAYLDPDVGQPEFTPPGLLSLTIVEKPISDMKRPCLKTPERCLFFGDTSAKRNPDLYLECMFALSDYYQLKCHSQNCTVDEMPLIVNTPGWVKGIGYNVLVRMLKRLPITHVVKINISAENKNIPSGKFWLDGDGNDSIQLIEIEPPRQDHLNRSILTAKDGSLIRDVRLLAYFRQCFPSNSDITKIKELARALAALPPYEVPIASIKIKHLHMQVPRREVFYSLNGSIVGLGVSSMGTDDLPFSVGLGIVRGIDLMKGLLYVITPIPLQILEEVDILLQGFIETPTSLLQVKGYLSPYISLDAVPTT
ncbi:hypothetical protein MLD38_027952 [Melastoma candidum]|uniref:Uncharacterized protein n=1 Tax=Melastoma candidum TaxID=119954 RepID=A0ACB9MZN1_9MYRT|nr:hypothetical protein MLD38_027952 [Melastoma candidum]